MLATSLLRDDFCLGSVRCRGSRDALRDRRRLETALSHIARDGFGLPKTALLFTRRLVPALPLGRGAATRRFADAVKAELAGKLRSARRPWLHADVVGADSVLFLDDAELAACLVRDWLGNRVLERWWWRLVLGNLSANEWLRRRVIATGEMLAVTTERLADVDAVAWFRRMDTGDCARAWVALRDAYGVETWGASVAASVLEKQPCAPNEAGAVEMPARALEAIERLLRAVPEAASRDISPERAALLATALIVRRDLTWARSPLLAMAFQVGARGSRFSVESGSESLRENFESKFASSFSKPTASELPPVHAAAAEIAADPIQSPGQSIDDSIAPIRTMDSSFATHGKRPALAIDTREPQATGQVARPVADGDEAANQEAPMLARAFDNPVTPRARMSIDPGTSPGYAAGAEAVPVRTCENRLDAAPIETGFGGIFYLLNVALALGLYGDFTMPRYRGIDLSPWDWLAAIGRRWFGNEFRKDPIWQLLAVLAGHPPRRRPERGFKPPTPGEVQLPFVAKTTRLWFEGLLTYLNARIGRAIGADDPAQVPRRVCRHRALIYMSASAVDVHLSLDDLPIELRAAGLDRDPGWIPATGRSVRFHFE